MGILDRMLQAASTPPRNRRGGEGPRVSPQGWVDRHPVWPAEEFRSAFSSIFEDPWSAVAHLASSFECMVPAGSEPDPASMRWARGIDGYTRALQALFMPAVELPLRTGTYGRLVALLVEHLDRAPVLLTDVVVDRQVGALIRALGSLESFPDLLALGRQLDEAAERARKVLEARAPRAPMPLPDSDPEKGTRDPLTAEDVLSILLSECLRDQQLSVAEERALSELRNLLGVPVERYRQLKSRAALDLATMGSGQGEMQPLQFFERLFVRALSDRVLEVEELRLLAAVGRYLGITQAEIDMLKKYLMTRFGAWTTETS